MKSGTTFGARLHAAVSARGPLCAGIDPHAALLHEWGLDDSVAGLERFALAATEALAAECAVVKPQSAFYERFGSRGVAVLERVITTARDAGALVLLDVKRGDIGSTSEAYAEAYLDPASPIGQARPSETPISVWESAVAAGSPSVAAISAQRFAWSRHCLCSPLRR